MTRYQLYPMMHWHVVREEDARIVFRPSAQTMSRRLMWTFLAAIIMLFLYFAVGRHLRPASAAAMAPAEPVSPAELQRMTEELETDLRERMTDEEWREFQAERQAKQQERQARRATQNTMLGNLGRVFRGAYWALFGILVVSGIYGPLSTVWQQIVIERDARGDLAIRSRDIIPQVHRWPHSAFEFIATRAEQQVNYQRYGGYTPSGWRWQVALVPREGIETLAEFWVSYENERPALDKTVPQDVVQFVKALKRITGLPAREPSFVEFQGAQRGLLKSRLRFSRRGPSGPGATAHTTYRSMDEIPEHLRPQAETLMAEARRKAGNSGWGAASRTTARYQVADEKGNIQTYESLDDMPPEIRARIEQLQRDARNKK